MTSWQGGSETVGADLNQVAVGKYVASRPMPVTGSWKTMVSLQRGDEVMAERRTEDALDLYRTTAGPLNVLSPRSISHALPVELPKTPHSRPRSASTRTHSWSDV